ncbi:RNA ligase family protein [Cytobacillus firmus]|nr:RNA ligase family protein [Cytobacillus firmus]
MEFKKYPKVERLGKKTAIAIGERIEVMEKLDGSNASFTLEEGVIKKFSRNLPLDPSNNLRGFYQYIDEKITIDMLYEDYIYFGEWMVPHKVSYKEEYVKTFILFDVYSKSRQRFLSLNTVRSQANLLGFKVAPVLYEGPLTSMEMLKGLVGKSEINGDNSGEGVVVRYGNVRLKWVSEGFAEKAGISYKEPKPETLEKLFVATYVTEARVEKILHKLVDEGVINPDEVSLKDMGWLMVVVADRVNDDVLEEEGDELHADASLKEIRSCIGKRIGGTVRGFVTKLEMGSL